MSEQINPFQHIKIEHLAPSPTNPRKHFDQDALRELADTIADQGVIEPIIVRCWPDEYDTPNPIQGRPLYEIIAGERRYRASLLAGRDTIPALVRNLNTRQVLEIQVIENLQRRGVNELEEAEGYQLMMREYGYTADELAAKVGKSRAYIYGRLKLCALCEDARQAYRDGKLDASRALLIARIPGAALQVQAVKEITDGYLGVMSYRHAANHIQNHYMRGLRHAIFALDDATLRPEAGPCTTCPKRPCNTPELYPDVPADRAADVCTDTECMKTKTDTHLQRQVDAAAAIGRKVVRAASWSEWSGYMELNEEDDDLFQSIPVMADSDDEDRRAPTVAEMLEETGAQLEIVLVEHPSTHNLIECVRKDEYRKAVPAPEQGEAQPSSWAQRDAECKAEASRRHEIFAAIRQRYDRDAASWASPIATELRVIAHQFWAARGPSTRTAVAKLNNLTIESGANITSWLANANTPDLIALLLDLALEPATDVPVYITDITTPAPLLDMCKALGIDPENPTAPSIAAPKTAPTPEQAPPGGEETASEKPGTPYRHPEHTNLGWSGRGRKPRWVEDWLENGGTLEQLSTANKAAPADGADTASPPDTSTPGQDEVQAATAARKPKGKAKNGGRAAAGGKSPDSDDPPQYRCPNTPDMLEGAAV